MKTLAFAAAFLTLATATSAQTAAPQTLSTLIAWLEVKGDQILDADLEGSWMEVDAFT